MMRHHNSFRCSSTQQRLFETVVIILGVRRASVGALANSRRLKARRRPPRPGNDAVAPPKV